MKEKNSLFIISIIFLAVLCPFVSCNSSSKTNTTDNEEWVYVQPGTTSNPNQASQEQKESTTFNPNQISKEQYDATMEDVKRFIEDLNQKISKKDYNSWKEALSPEYFKKISSPENLRQVSELPAMKTRKITLKSVNDYFNYVVVPSRANSRVDKIEFIRENRVKAFTIDTNAEGKERQLRLYDLEKTDNIWKIID